MRLIDADQLIVNRGENDPVVIAAKCVEAIDATKIVYGEWVMDGKDHCHCSSCGYGRNIKTQVGWKYCPNCGAKMDLGDE